MIRRNNHPLLEMLFLQHHLEEVEAMEESKVEEEEGVLAEVIFTAPIVIKMVTLKVIAFKRKEIPLIQILRKEEGENSQTLFLTCNKLEACDDFTWYLDSGCSNHMYGNKKLFVKLDENVKGTTSFGNDNEGDVMGKCTIAK